MKKFITIIILMIIPYYCVYAAEQETTDFCSSLQPSFNQLNEQLPKQIDFMTTLIGISAVVIGNNCHINAEYVMSEEKHIKLYVQEGFSKNEAVDYINSKEARNDMISGLKSSVAPALQQAALRPDVDFTARYRHDGNKLKGFEINL